MSNIVPKQFAKLQPTDKDGSRRKLSHWGNTSNNFFATIGCSMTYGYSMEYKDTWSNLVSEHFQMEHINLSFCGSSIEYQSEIINRLLKLLPSVKFCIWMQTLPTRSHSTDSTLSDQERRIHDHTSWNESSTYRKIIEHFKKFSDINIICVNSWGYPKPYLKLLNAWSKNQPKFFVNNNDIIDFGSDNLHPGVQTNKRLAEDLIDHIRKNFQQWVDIN